MNLPQLEEHTPMTDDKTLLLNRTTEIVAAYVARNSVPAAELPALLASVHASLSGIVTGPKPEPAAAALIPKMSIKVSLKPDSIGCMCCGKRFVSLKRHLMAEHAMSPQDYRAAFALPKDFPMVSADYAAARSQLAKTLGLGRKATAVAVEVPPPPAIAAKAPRQGKANGGVAGHA